MKSDVFLPNGTREQMAGGKEGVCLSVEGRKNEWEFFE